MISFDQYLQSDKKPSGDLTESTIKRFASKFKQFDSAIITAYRGEFVKKENQARNKELFSALYASGFSVTSVKGSYIENFGSKDEYEASEHSFVVVNHKENDGFHKTLIKLAKRYDQDSVLLIHKGENPKAELVGTSKRDNAYPPYGKSETMNKLLQTSKGQEFFTRLGNNGFAFINENVAQYDCDIFLPETRQSKQGCQLMGERVLEYLDSIED